MAQPRDPSRPAHAADIPLGYRIKQLRENLGLTQSALAARSGVNVGTIRHLEQGRRPSCSLPNLHALARTLDVPAGYLLDSLRQLGSDGKDDGIPQGAIAIRHALTAMDDLLGADDDIDLEPLSVAEGRLTLAEGWRHYWAGAYDRLGAILPTAIQRARATVHDAPADEQAAAHSVAAEILRLSAATLVHVGYIDIAHLALREGLELAVKGDDPLVMEALRTSMVWKLLVEGRFAESQHLALVRAAALEPAGRDVTMPQMSLYGALLLSAATAAGRAGDRGTALHMVGEAVPVAERTGQRNDYETVFGPDQVLMQAVDVDIVTEHYAGALRTSQRMPVEPDLPLAARARHLADVALAHVRLGRDGAALDVMERIEGMAPTWAGFQEQPRQVVSELWVRAHRPPQRLTRLARRLGVAS